MVYSYLDSLSTEQLAKFDLAELNLRFAEGLPGSERLVIRECLHQVERIVRKVKKFTDDRRLLFRNNPGECGGTPGRFRMLCLATVIQLAFKINYRDVNDVLSSASEAFGR
jgi:hypothetical protein